MQLPLVFGLLLATSLAAEDPKELKPAPDAKPHEARAWKSKSGLRFTWTLPKGYDSKRPVALTVICHGTGLDYRWGQWNNKPGLFRPDDVVVSVDGPSPGPNNSRLFLGEPKDAKAFKDFLDEMRTTFTVDRVLLYGHSQGGFFVVYFAGEYPDAVDGVVAHASGAWNWSKTGKPVHRVAIAFMHGTADPVVPYPQSPGSREAYVTAGFPLVHLRRLQNYNHWPNAVRANECLAWCEGMTTENAGIALRAAEAIVQKKSADEYQWETVVGFSAARQVLGRITGDEKPALASASPETKAAAAKLISRIEEHGQAHVDALKKHLVKKADLTLDKPAPWLGHLVPLREDFRGVRSVEAFIKSIEHDAVAKTHQKPFANVLSAWYDQKGTEVTKVKAILTNLPLAFLCEGFSPELRERLVEWPKSYKKQLGKSDLLNVPRCEAWEKGWKDGLESYANLWKQWK